MTESNVETFRSSLDDLTHRAAQFFNSAENNLKADYDVAWDSSNEFEGDRFFSKLPDDLRAQAEVLVQELLRLMAGIADLIPIAVLASEADQRKL